MVEAGHPHPFIPTVVNVTQQKQGELLVIVSSKTLVQNIYKWSSKQNVNESNDQIKKALLSLKKARKQKYQYLNSHAKTVVIELP